MYIFLNVCPYLDECVSTYTSTCVLVPKLNQKSLINITVYLELTIEKKCAPSTDCMRVTTIFNISDKLKWVSLYFTIAILLCQHVSNAKRRNLKLSGFIIPLSMNKNSNNIQCQNCQHHFNCSILLAFQVFATAWIVKYIGPIFESMKYTEAGIWTEWKRLTRYDSALDLTLWRFHLTQDYQKIFYNITDIVNNLKTVWVLDL